MTRLVVALVLLAAACGSAGIAIEPATPTSTVASTVTMAALAPTTSSTAPTTPTTRAPATTTTDAPTTTPTTGAAPVLLVDGAPMIRFSVEVGEGIDLSRDDFARFVIATLSDERSWVGRGTGFELLDEGGLFTMIVARPADVDEMCAPLQTNGRFSCARNGWIAFNSLRWFGATDDWPADLEIYQRYLVNHEVGHYIVGPGHDACPASGAIAPIMMQQTKGLDGCLANGWVDP